MMLLVHAKHAQEMWSASANCAKHNCRAVELLPTVPNMLCLDNANCANLMC